MTGDVTREKSPFAGLTSSPPTLMKAFLLKSSKSELMCVGIGVSQVAVTSPSATRIVCPATTTESSHANIGESTSGTSRRHRTEGFSPLRSRPTSVEGWSCPPKKATRRPSTSL